MTQSQAVDLESCEKETDADDELLFRQITKHKFNEDEGIPASSAFGPVTSDGGRPSFARESHDGVTAQSSRDWHQRHARSPSLGVWAASTGEVAKAKLRSVYDGDCPVPTENLRAPGHTYVDYRGLSPKETRDARAKLLMRALHRGELPTTDLLAAPDPTDGSDESS